MPAATYDLAPALQTSWRQMVRPYERPSVARSLLQIVTTFAGLSAGFYGMYASLALSYAVTLLLSLPTALFLVRNFVLMHDCTHGSLFPKRWMNDVVGWVTGLLLLTPYVRWRREHNLHHVTTGDLDRRGDGDIWMMTVREYRDATWWQRFGYRAYRHPLVFLSIGPLKFALLMRLYPKGRANGPKERSSVRETNLTLLGVFLGFSALVGPLAVLAVFLPTFTIAMAIGIWLIFVQHQFEGAYWVQHDEWDFATAAIKGSSYLKLPRLLDWFTGSVGFHHVHHLSPRIPNYRLRECHRAHKELQQAHVITMRDTRRTLRLTLWDEERGQLVGFDDVR